ncbi:putative RNA recognition motif domain, nucleotide-binding alpha-beta plait domain superfamily [Arabidopsis thaliana]
MPPRTGKDKQNPRLPPEVTRLLYIRNYLPFSITSEDMYDLFGRYSAIRQVRIGCEKGTKGTAFVVYEDIYDAKKAVDHLWLQHSEPVSYRALLPTCKDEQEV